MRSSWLCMWGFLKRDLFERFVLNMQFTGNFFLRTEQKLLAKLTFKNLKSLSVHTVSVKSQWFRIFSVHKNVPHQYKWKIALHSFLMWVWGVIFIPLLEKVTCTSVSMLALWCSVSVSVDAFIWMKESGYPLFQGFSLTSWGWHL